MLSEYDEKVKKYWKLVYGLYIVEMIDDASLEEGFEKLNTTPLHNGAFVLSNFKKIYDLIHSCCQCCQSNLCLLHRQRFSKN